MGTPNCEFTTRPKRRCPVSESQPNCPPHHRGLGKSQSVLHCLSINQGCSRACQHPGAGLQMPGMPRYFSTQEQTGPVWPSGHELGLRPEAIRHTSRRRAPLRISGIFQIHVDGRPVICGTGLFHQPCRRTTKGPTGSDSPPGRMGRVKHIAGAVAGGSPCFGRRQRNGPGHSRRKERLATI